MEVLLATLVLLAAPEAKPYRIAGYCSPSGDLCYGIVRRDGAVFLEIDTFARYFSRYRLCVDGPRGGNVCRSFVIRRRGRLFGSRVRWHTSFRGEGAGTYRVRWRLGGEPLGPPLRFRLRQ